MKRLAAIAIAATLLAGCGGESDQDKAKATVTDFGAAVQAKDGDKACALLNTESRTAVGQTLEAVNGGPSATGGSSACASELIGLNAKDRKAFDRVTRQKVQDVDVKGDTATIRVAGGVYKLEERDGDYILAGVEPLAGALARVQDNATQADDAELDDTLACVDNPKLEDCKPDPNAPGGTKDLERQNRDSDGDGIADVNDKTP